MLLYLVECPSGDQVVKVENIHWTQLESNKKPWKSQGKPITYVKKEVGVSIEFC
jgi:hypothetical protein